MNYPQAPDPDLYRWLIYDPENQVLALVLAMDEHAILACLGLDARNARIDRIPCAPGDFALWNFLGNRSIPGVVILSKWEETRYASHLATYWELYYA